MTEKQFNLANPNSSFLSMNCGIKYGDRLLNFKEVVVLLNSLNDENEQLRARNKYLERKIQRERNIHVKEHEKWEEEIQKENEKIKQQRDFYYARLQKIIRIANGDLE